MRLHELTLLEQYRCHDRHRDEMFFVHRNPGRATYRGLIANSSRKCLRAFITDRDVLAWDAEHIHETVEYCGDREIQRIVADPAVVRCVMNADGVVLDALWTESDEEHEAAVATIRGNGCLIGLWGSPVPVLEEGDAEGGWG